MQHGSAFLSLVENIRAKIQTVDIYTVKNWQDSHKAIILIDVREESEWQVKRIPDAVHLSKGVLERDIEAKYANKQACLVLYCAGGFRSVLATENLNKMGYQQVFSMDGGIRMWEQAGYPIQL